MPVSVIISFSLITTALLFYSIGVWAERINRFLKPWHVLAFWTGFTFDVAGTLVMHQMSTRPFNLLDSHTFTGQLALWLMLVHAIWSSYVVRKGSERSRTTFHKYSIIVWLIWLIPYFGGIYMGMNS